MAQRKHPFQRLDGGTANESINDPQESEVPGGPAPSNPPYPHPAPKQSGPPQGVSEGAGGTDVRGGTRGPAPDDGADVWQAAPGAEQVQGKSDRLTSQHGEGTTDGIL